MKHLYISICIFILLFRCAPQTVSISVEQDQENFQTLYYSDYFVFLSANHETSLIVPIDINWEPRPDKQIFLELKAWHGTEKQWPMFYRKKTQTLSDAPFPKTWSKIPSVSGFSVQADKIQVNQKSLGEIALRIPPKEEGKKFVETNEIGTVVYRVYQTSIFVNEREISGWLIHENVQFKQIIKEQTQSSLFTRFHWIPLITAKSLYLFRHDSKQGQLAIKWSKTEQGLDVSSIKNFSFEEIDHTPEKTSKRKRVPIEWKIVAKDWDFSATLKTTAGHTGYGSEKESGRALYRQATVVGTSKEKPIHGMVELILED